MPIFNKEALSKYIRTECRRQFKLNLSPDNSTYSAERITQGMPPPQVPRPGLEQLRQAGIEWEAEVFSYLTRAFGSITVLGNSYQHESGQTRYRSSLLQNLLTNVTADSLLIEAEYEVTQTFKTALAITRYDTQFNLRYSVVRPDIIEVLPPGYQNYYVTPDGEKGQLPDGDTRFQLRIIDIKVTSEPSPSYFAEVTYYTMVLAGWLIENHLDHQFAAVPYGAIWSGSYESSHLVITYNKFNSQGIVPTHQELRRAMELDIEFVPFEVFATRLRRLLQVELQEVLAENSWQNLDWHVDSRCKGCDNLGYSWENAQGATWHPLHCMPTAKQNHHLSRVAFISRGARLALQERGVLDVTTLATLSADDNSFDTHQTLRSTRTVISGRANALQTGEAQIPPASGTSAIMPKWADLHIFLSVDFDLGSAITFAFGLKAFWLEPRPFNSNNSAQRRNEDLEYFFAVDQKDLQVEQRELLNFLAQIHNILIDKQNINNDSTVQFYIWDSTQYKHLTRIIGRHLQAILGNQTINYLAWLFPPEELLPNARLSTRNSPITVVKEIVRSVLAAPVPHHYSLLEVARSYNYSNSNLPISVHPMFEDILSDLIPSERAHNIWSRSRQPYWKDQMNILGETVRKRLYALKLITDKLEQDLSGLDRTAPKIRAIEPPNRENRLSRDSQLWYAFAKLNSVMSELEVHQVRVMPPHEREARFHSARLTRQLEGVDEQQALNQLGLQARPVRRIYEIQPNSRHIKLRDGDFNFALAPENEQGFLDRSLVSMIQGTDIEQELGQVWTITMEDVTSVTVVAIDRENCLMVIDQNQSWSNRLSLDELERQNLANLTSNVILDPVHHDFFTKKLLASLRAIGNPRIARDNDLVRRATGQLTGTGARVTSITPAAELLWNAGNMHRTRISRSLPSVRASLQQHGLNLNTNQWLAWEEALSRRLQLVWGPPGTGKSHTARAIIVGAALEAYNSNSKKIRILVCASTYTAIDNILLDIYEDTHTLLPENIFEFYRLRSYLQTAPTDIRASQIDTELNRYDPSSAIGQLVQRLVQEIDITVVGATPEQVHNLLLVINENSPQGELFDLILIDEASQMDVAHSILAICALAKNGSVILAGDPLQLPPIHQAEAPKGLENMVGSVYTFCHEFQQVPHIMLNKNYRSNTTLVEFARNAGYNQDLVSYSPRLQLNLLEPLPTTQPFNWSDTLYWTSEWSALLDPNYPASCFIYQDGRSSQWNQFEADAVVALITLLNNRMGERLLNEHDYVTGQTIPVTQEPYTSDRFWKKAIGVVTPHRAQQGLIVSKLQQIFSNTGVSSTAIRDAVDTVERFQGQQRDVIIASFALGDPDFIADEDEFLMSLNRFNVMASRARAKLILLISQEVVDHLASDLDTLRESRLLKLYAESFCQNARPMTLGFYDSNHNICYKTGIFKYR